MYDGNDLTRQTVKMWEVFLDARWVFTRRREKTRRGEDVIRALGSSRPSRLRVRKQHDGVRVYPHETAKNRFFEILYKWCISDGELIEIL